MCDECEQAVMAQKFSELDDVTSFESGPENHWMTRCRACGQLWETYAYMPSYSWELTPEQAKDRYTGLSLAPFVAKNRGLYSNILHWINRVLRRH